MAYIYQLGERKKTQILFELLELTSKTENHQNEIVYNTREGRAGKKNKKKRESIIGEGRISHDRMRHSLQGSNILQKYSFSQIRTRLKY